MFRIEIIKLCGWLFSRVLASHAGGPGFDSRPEHVSPEPVLLNEYGAPESIPRNEFRQPMCLAGRYDDPIATRCLAPIDFLKFQLRDLKIGIVPLTSACSTCQREKV
jgi:hypothetical protein